MGPKILYVSFDVLPSPKGAAVHILQISRFLAEEFGSLQLCTVANTEEYPNGTPIQCRLLETGIEQILIPAPGQNLIDRINNFRRFLEIACKNKYFDIVHFRSPFEGLIFAKDKSKYCNALVFEVNALPSIELKYRYPRVADDFEFMQKLLGQEELCLEKSDLIITTSQLSKAFLTQKHANLDSKIKVIPNAVDLSLFQFEPLNAQKDILHLLYFGTLSAWQGVNTAIDATAVLNAEGIASKLTIVAAARPQQIAKIGELISKKQLDNWVEILPARTQAELIPLMHECDIVLAPLSNNDRNAEQGCCPLKIVEGMAVGRPVLSTTLPVVQEIAGIPPVIHLCKPDSAGSLKDAIKMIVEDRNQTEHLAKAARQKIEKEFSLDNARAKILEAYRFLLSKASTSSVS